MTPYNTLVLSRSRPVSFKMRHAFHLWRDVPFTRQIDQM